jgi:hypothetical protein
MKILDFAEFSRRYSTTGVANTGELDSPVQPTPVSQITSVAYTGESTCSHRNSPV